MKFAQLYLASNSLAVKVFIYPPHSSPKPCSYQVGSSFDLANICWSNLPTEFKKAYFFITFFFYHFTKQAWISPLKPATAAVLAYRLTYDFSTVQHGHTDLGQRRGKITLICLAMVVWTELTPLSRMSTWFGEHHSRWNTWNWEPVGGGFRCAADRPARLLSEGGKKTQTNEPKNCMSAQSSSMKNEICNVEMRT